MLEDDDDFEPLAAETSEEEALAGAPNMAVAKKANAKGEKSGYRLPKGLEASRSTQYSTRALFDIVWSEQKQIGLIDSIFRNFYIPPVIFTVQSDEDGTERRICIDGKQRLTSIRRFTKEKLWFAENSRDPKRTIFSSSYRSLFQNKQMVCVEYSNLNDAQEREIFQRVQLGVALTTAEKMQAVLGPWAELCREVLEEFVNKEDGLGTKLDLDRKRSRDYHNVSQSIFSIAHLPKFVHVTTTQLEKWLSKKEGPTPIMRQKIMDTFRIFRDIAKDPKIRLPLTQPSRVAPIEFIMIGVLIAKFMDQLSFPQLSQAIGILRQEIRDEHDDLRNNTKVFKTMGTIINEKIALTTLKKTSGLPIAAVQITNSSNDGSIKTQTGASSRKRSHDAMEVDSEEPRIKARGVRGTPSDSTAQLHETAETTEQSPSEQTRAPTNLGAFSQTVVNNALARLNAAKAEVQNKYGDNNPMQRFFIAPSQATIHPVNSLENDIQVSQKITPSTTSPAPSIPSSHSTPRDGSLALPQRPYTANFDSSYQDRNSRYASAKDTRDYANSASDGRSDRRDSYSRDADKEREWTDRDRDRGRGRERDRERERDRDRDRGRDRERGYERDRRYNR